MAYVYCSDQTHKLIKKEAAEREMSMGEMLELAWGAYRATQSNTLDGTGGKNKALEDIASTGISGKLDSIIKILGTLERQIEELSRSAAALPHGGGDESHQVRKVLREQKAKAQRRDKPA